ncbi:phage antirepressor KilAC domain-containing protein [Arsenophonus sp. aPb]|uniref:phage antirepressor KilAC domain-containing protein n=1 Tax=Arsenophonus sp. aPb TaxID=3041619 RepID=UPI002469B81D|nr:phage antirepressor KilAC domain-containing protein [Arsenophonus sp. aPb]WGL97228.1 phage antirepressor KilAC domain-containing protein [Arsenophonus sp. aPb]
MIRKCLDNNEDETPTARTVRVSKMLTISNEINNMNIANKNLPVIAGVEITTDSEGRFNLNALHKASGEGKHKRPSKWLATTQSKELIAQLEANLLKNNQSPNSGLGHEVINSIKGSTNPGNFAHELLAIEYAGWISPKFRLTVNQTFLDFKAGKLATVVKDPMEILNDPSAMRGILLTYTKKVIALEHKVDEMKPDVAALERIAKSDGAMCITDAAKQLQTRPKQLFDFLSERKWIYRRLGSTWIGYQDKIQQGLIEHKVTTITRTDGVAETKTQVRITPKGIAKLAKLLSVEVAA